MHRIFPQRPRHGWWLASFATLVATLVAAVPAHARSKTDVITMDNGDRFTGEIKWLKQGVLSVSTDSLGTLSIEWTHVARVESAFVFQIEMTSGAVLLGSLAGDTDPERLRVGGEGGSAARRDEMVRMAPIEARLLDRFEGSVSAGVSYAKGSQSRQTNLNLDATYYSELYQARTTLSSLATSDGDSGDRSERDDLAFTYRRLRPNRWFGLGVFEAQRNDELGIDLRTSLGGGFGRFVLQSQRLQTSLSGGLLLSREWIAGDENEKNNEVEAFLGFAHNYYVFDSPRVSFATELTAYPGLSSWGRVRAEFDTALKWELVRDFFWSLQLYGSYDSEPPAVEGATSDYGFVTSLGYNF